MPKVKVLLMGDIRKRVGWYNRELEIKGDTIGELLRELKTQDGQPVENLVCCHKCVKPDYWILINGNEVRRDKGLETRVNNGDKIVIMPVIPMMAGG